jgi:hypothetical protein
MMRAAMLVALCGLAAAVTPSVEELKQDMIKLSTQCRVSRGNCKAMGAHTAHTEIFAASTSQCTAPGTAPEMGHGDRGLTAAAYETWARTYLTNWNAQLRKTPLLSDYNCCRTYAKNPSQCSNRVNSCGYHNDRGEVFWMSQAGGAACSTLHDTPLPENSVVTTQNSNSGGVVAHRTCTQSLMPGTPGELPYAAMCPDTCVIHPHCVTTDQDYLMTSQFNAPCSAYAGAGWCTEEGSPTGGTSPLMGLTRPTSRV